MQNFSRKVLLGSMSVILDDNSLGSLYTFVLIITNNLFQKVADKNQYYF